MFRSTLVRRSTPGKENLWSLSLYEAATLLEEGSVTSVEIVQSVLARIEQLEPQIRAYVTVDRAGSLRQAEQADQMRAQGSFTPLTGIPIAHKDIFCTRDLPTTCSSKMLAHFVPPYDATVTRLLREAGAVIIGKANMDEFAMGSSTESSHFGATRNPWDLARSPGGSSGGSAAAVAAGMAIAATGTDTGGSIRQPAALTGITGIKPTYGRISRYGIIAYASSLDQAGVMTQTAEDAALLMNILACHDPLDSTSTPAPVPDYTAALALGVKEIRIGIPTEFFPAELDEGISRAIDQAKDVFSHLGAKIVPVSLPHTQWAVPTYYILATAEASSNLARYDGVKFGYRCAQPQNLRDLYMRTRAEGFGAEVKRRIMLGTYVLSAGYFDAYYRKAQKARRLIADDFHKAFQSVDLLLTPVTPTTAFRLGELIDDPVQMYLFDIFTLGVSLAGLPAMSLPCGLSRDNLPVGFQLVAPPLQEERLFQAAGAFQSHTDFHTLKPNLHG
ncbi:MAG: Asp-tRNA(Asn)/Glu-tRNA(Gln) amidotransferase subunit GatA [Magnetococcales bacterium]|nr:Asp-tRNA(Asn)/Glu-tRNA(Gln) amidotransferase subunit GatA [Magnetococcales bacterium]